MLILDTTAVLLTPRDATEIALLAGIDVVAVSLVNIQLARLAVQHWLLGARAAGGILAPVPLVLTLITVNVGPLLTPSGFSANLLWWRRCRPRSRGVSAIPWGRGWLAVGYR